MLPLISEMQLKNDESIEAHQRLSHDYFVAKNTRLRPQHDNFADFHLIIPIFTAIH